jgi:hypothetical protein
MKTTLPFAHGESRKKRFGLTNDRKTVSNIEFRHVITRIKRDFADTTTSGLSFQRVEDTTAVAAATRVLVDRHVSYLGFARGGQMQSTAGQSFPGCVHQQEMKRRIILRIAFAAAWLAPRLA